MNSLIAQSPFQQETLLRIGEKSCGYGKRISLSVLFLRTGFAALAAFVFFAAAFFENAIRCTDFLYTDIRTDLIL
jgi:hypothetical protein